MKKIVLDTNVFMSGIFWSGPPAKILNAWQEHKLELLLSTEILDEYIRIGNALSKKYPGVDVAPFIDMVALHGKIFEPVKLIKPVCRDPNDDMFIATAISSRSNMIISGDKDLLAIDGYSNVTVIRPSKFVEDYL